ncbi:MAG: hypothetical protein Q8O41_01720 [Candidatus Methanoperedens sp.]|nr:hypothetical protein [Candidatus Methanoperedens sp.]
MAVFPYSREPNSQITPGIDYGRRGDIEYSIQWLLEKPERDNWGNITTTSLSLISLKMYLDKLNSGSGNEKTKERES